MDNISVKIVNTSGHALPSYATVSSAGMDVRAHLSEPVVLGPLERALIPTGLRVQHGITLVNTPGTIDADYRGEIGVILVNLSDRPFTVNDGERICQMVIAPYTRVQWTSTETLDDSERGAGGFGHTGVK